MTTVQDLVDETRRHLHGGMQDRLNLLNSNISSTSSTTVTFQDDIKGIGPGSVVEVGSESMYVRSSDADAKSAVVIRGHGSSVAATHTSGAVARVNPSYSSNDIFMGVVDEINSLKGSGLLQFDTQDVSYTGTVKTFDLTLSTSGRTPLFVQQASYQRSASSLARSPMRVELVSGMDAGSFASTYALRVLGSPPVSTIRVTVAFSLGVPSALSDDLADFGITDSIKPIIPVGTAWRLLLGKEARRVNPDASHGSRRAEEVQPGSISFLGRALRSMRDDLVRDALEDQMKRYPPRQDIQ